ncbi:MAG: polysaccharide deacetylase family protein, partial [Deltaproteobacteria bacterium]|nr:polysaccharide deacetylase family protein [Deltaproteobacteria bacterium]
MVHRSLLRRLKVGTKHLLDHIRPYFLLTGISPIPGYTARQFGSLIHREASVRGRLGLCEPAWFQMNRGAFCRNIRVPGKHFCYVGEDSSLLDRTVRSHTMVFDGAILEGRECPARGITVSVDLEGNTASSCDGSAGEREVQREAAERARIIHSIFQDLGLRTVWYVVGSLFEDREMKSLCEEIMDDPNIEIGWHTQNHINYFDADEDAVKRDMECADTIRHRYSLDMT